MKKVLLWIVGIFVALIVIGALFGGDNKDKKANDTTKPAAPQTSNAASAAPAAAPAPTAATAVSVTAAELTKAYKDNEIAANDKFKDKTLLVSGKLESIEAGITDKPELVLSTNIDYGMNNPRATLADSDVDKAKSLKKGQSIKMLCTGDSEVAGTPMLKDCKIQ